MPKTIGNGKTTMQNQVFEATVLCRSIANSVTDLFNAVDTAVSKNMLDDPYMAEAYRLMKESQGEFNTAARESMVARAISNMELAIRADQDGDAAILEIKRSILPDLNKVDAVKASFMELQKKLSAKPAAKVTKEVAA